VCSDTFFLHSGNYDDRLFRAGLVKVPPDVGLQSVPDVLVSERQIEPLRGEVGSIRAEDRQSEICTTVVPISA
jgi:hypothetical protein